MTQEEKIEDKQSLELSITSAVAEYAYDTEDKDFNVIVEVSCKDGQADAKIVEDDIINGYVLSAISTVCKTSEPEKFAEHNLSAFIIARLAVSLALHEKGGNL